MGEVTKAQLRETLAELVEALEEGVPVPVTPKGVIVSGYTLQRLDGLKKDAQDLLEEKQCKDCVESKVVGEVLACTSYSQFLQPVWLKVTLAFDVDDVDANKCKRFNRRTEK